jgi:S1-C subfamily serine protease
VIGVNSQIASEAASINGSQAGSTGVGFAVSSDTVAQAVKQIEAGDGVSSSSTRLPGMRSSGREGETYETQSPLGGGTRGQSQGGEVEAERQESEVSGGSTDVEEGADGSGAAGAVGQGRIVIVP